MTRPMANEVNKGIMRHYRKEISHTGNMDVLDELVAMSDICHVPAIPT